MKKIRVKYFIVGMLLILEIVSLTLMYKSSHNKEIVLDEVKLKEFLKNNMISIMTDETGNGTYTEYTSSSTFPSNYIYNASKSHCINEKGSIVKDVLTYDGTKAVLTSNEGMHCTLYFDKTMPLNQFCDGQANMGACIANKKSTIGRVENMTSSEVGGMYRYQGTDNVNNYICFGTSDKSKCTTEEGIDKYMYRIIGVTPDGELALIKETVVKENGTTTSFQWNDKYDTSTSQCGADGSLCTWATSKLYNRLNGLCKEGNPNCSGTGEGSKGQTNIFIGNNYYEYLSNSTWLNKIDETHKWKYGDTNKNNGNYDGDTIYKIENVFTSSVEAKIGLQYLHDYYYAYPNGSPGGYDTAKNAWIFFQKDGYNSGISSEWLIIKYGVLTSVRAWCVTSSGIMSHNYLRGYIGVRPVFYLKSDIVLKSGSAGSKTDPYIIDGTPDLISLGEFCDGQTNMGTCLNAKKNSIGLVTNMTAVEVGGMYRYQGTTNVNNYICFGTTDKSKCISGGDAYGDGIDKYMYRIIGVTKDGQLVLIKETTIKEENDVGFEWSINCAADASKCLWNNTRLFNRINGLCTSSNANCSGIGSGSKGQTNIFIGNSYYEYLATGNTWLNKINPHNWKYGEVTSNGNYNGDSAYAIESQFTDSIPDAKIGLQYIHDYLYAFPNGNPINAENAKNSWIFFMKDGYNVQMYDYLMDTNGLSTSTPSTVSINPNGAVIYSYYTGIYGTRPVFFLNSTVKINNAEGSKTDPFIITN